MSGLERHIAQLEKIQKSRKKYVIASNSVEDAVYMFGIHKKL